MNDGDAAPEAGAPAPAGGAATPRSPLRALVIAGSLAVAITAVAVTLSSLRRRPATTPAAPLLAPDGGGTAGGAAR